MRASQKLTIAAATRKSMAVSWALFLAASPVWAANQTSVSHDEILQKAEKLGPPKGLLGSQDKAPVPPTFHLPSTGANISDGPASTASEPATDSTKEPPVQKLLLKPGKSLSVGMATEDIVCTNDVDLARRQRESYPDSPEASFIYAVALSRSSRVEDALKEVRRARRLAEKQGGPAYFDKMIETYENMLTYYPDDNQVRYHLAWAYYMKAYVLAKYSHLANTPQAKYKEWVAQASKPDAPAKPDVTADDGNDVLKNIHSASSTISGASPQAIPQVQKYYALATAKLDDLLARDPGDASARVYRAYLHAEASGDLASAMTEWQKVKDQQPLNPAAYFFLGEGYLKQGNLKECFFNVSKAVALRSAGN